MTLEKKSVDILVVFLGLMIAAFGLVSFGLDLTAWLVPTAALLGGVILLIEVGLKQITNISTLKKMGAQQYTTITIGLLSIVSGVLTLPPVNITIDFLNKIAGFVLILVGLFILIEWFTQR